MKKNYIAFMAWAVIAVMLTGCLTNKKSRLHRAIAEANKECPVETGIGTFDRIDYEGDVVTFVYTVDHDVISVDKLKAKEEGAKQVFSNNLTKEGVKPLLHEIVGVDASLCLDITDANSKAHMDIDFTTDELKKLLRKPVGNNNDVILQGEVMMTNLMTPAEVDFVTVLDSISLTKTKFIYHYTYDDNVLTADKITDAAVEQLKQENLNGIITMMRAPSGDNLKSCMEACVNTDRTLYHIYRGKNGGKPFQYSFSPDELDAAIRKSKAAIAPGTLPSLNL
ncbi:MAG: hypothetical protein IKX36_03780 [Prevotella sp.]|nr:hypothetical protein [Prevotella sp.]